MKKLTFLLLLCMASLGVMAKSVVFTLSDGTKVYYLLGGETNPVLHFEDGKIKVDADMYEISDIKNFVVSNEDDPNGIEDVLSGMDVSFSANTLVINSADVPVVKVFAVSGAEVPAEVVKNGNLVSVDLNGLSKGVYIIHVGKASLKVMKK